MSWTSPFLLCLFCLAAPSGPALAQSDAPFPTAAAEILSAGVRDNGLAGAKQPWHVRVHYEIVAYDGSPKESGTYEEFWVSAKQYRHTYVSEKFNQTDIATGDALYRNGDQDWPDRRESQVRTLMLQPIPQDLGLPDFDLEKTTRSFGSTELTCVVLKSKNTTNVRVVVVRQPILSAHYCFNPGRSMLRFASLGAGQDDTLFNSLVRFQGQYLAKEISLSNAKERLTLRVDLIEDLTNVNMTDFTSPAGSAGPLYSGGVLSLKSNALTILKRAPASYPDEARRKRIQGKVTMQVSIGKDGQVTNVEVLDGPAELRQAAIKSLQQTRFQPFLILQEPVEVSTKFDLSFTLNK